MRTNKELLSGFDSIKDDDETILWFERPRFIPYAITSLSLGSGVFIFVTLYFAMTNHFEENGGTVQPFSKWVVAIPVVLFLSSFISKILSFNNTCYGLTNKRILIRSGFVGTDFKIIDYDKIQDIKITVNLIERIFGVGTVEFFSGRTESNDRTQSKVYDRWEAIPNPYEVFKNVKKVSVDIKTDFNYPNALRPDTNPGYNTKYNPKK